MIGKRKRLWAMLLSAALVITQLPAVALAENAAPEDGAIASFEALDSDVAKQTVPVGTELSGLNLPDTVTATVYHVTEDTVIPDMDDTEDESGDSSTATPSDAGDSVSGNSSKDSSIKDSGETVTTVTTTEEQIPVTWDSEPAYDGDTADKYVFTADVGGYALSDNAKLPQITVTVAADTAENPTENPNEKPTGEPLPCALTEGCTLEDGHEGECVPAPPANDALVKTITGWTFVDDENLNEGELPLTSVSMDNQKDFDAVVSMLPKQISAKIEGEAEPATLDLTDWSCDKYKQDAGGNWPVAGDYTFTAALADGFACNPLPAVKVVLGGAALYANDEYDGLTITATNGGSVSQDTDKQITLNASGDYEISGTWNGTLDGVDYSHQKAVITVPDGVTANVTLDDMSINVSGTDYACAFAVAAGGTANISLTGTNTLTSGWGRAGLEVPENATVTIDGDGSLTANGGNNGAGIGGGYGSGGTITISGGTVTASSYNGAGIGGGCSGRGGGSGGTIIISGGTVTASSYNGAGIGGGSGDGIGGGSGGSITISGGTVTASSDSGAGIGGGSSGRGGGGSGGTITISGGTVTASSSRGAGIGGGYGSGDGGGGGGAGTWGGSGGQFSVNGNAVVFATSNSNLAESIGGGPGGSNGTKTLTEGVVFEGNKGTVYGNPELPGDLTIPAGSTLTVPDGSTLTVPDGTTLDNKGTINNEGTINSYGTITGNQPSGGTMNNASATTVTFAVKVNGGYGDDTTAAVFGDTVKITATAQRKTAATQYRSAAKDTVDFYIGSIDPDHKLGTADIATDNSTATAALEITLTGETWDKGFVPGPNTITADFGGADSLHLLDSTGTAELTVEMELSDAAAKVTAPATGNTPDTIATVDGSANYTVKNVTWHGALAADGKFDYDTAYTVNVVLNAKQYYRFASSVTGTINGQSANVSRTSDTEVVLSYTFDKTGVQPTWAVTVENGTGDGSYTKGATVNITADNAPSDKVFEKWTADSTDIIFDNPNSESTSFIMPDKAVTVTATYRNRPSSGGGGGSSSGGNSYSEPEPQSTYTVAGDNISRSVFRSDLKKLADSGKSLTLRCDKASMTFDPAALKAILAAVPATAGNITFAAAPADLSAFPDAAKQLGAHPVYDFTIRYKDGNGKLITVPVNFPAGSAAITLNYSKTAAETEGSLFMVYVDGKGAVTWLDKSSYDNGRVLAEVPHFSTYGVAYKAPAPMFTDISGHWAKQDIEFVAARGLLSGTGNNLFSPDGTMTRGMFVTAFYRLEGSPQAAGEGGAFTDVPVDAYYADAVAWANQNNIVNGIGGGLFAPGQSVTREQMAVILANYAKAVGFELPSVYAANVFADGEQIGAWARDAVKQMQMAGVLMGKDGNRFDPQGTATRAEASAMLHRFVERMIDASTAQGWTQNDSGQWLYYMDGKPVKSQTKNIGGEKYAFDANGVTLDYPRKKELLTYTVKAGDSFWGIAKAYNVSVYTLAEVNGTTIYSVIHPGDVLKIPQ